MGDRRAVDRRNNRHLDAQEGLGEPRAVGDDRRPAARAVADPFEARAVEIRAEAIARPGEYDDANVAIARSLPSLISGT